MSWPLNYMTCNGTGFSFFARCKQTTFFFSFNALTNIIISPGDVFALPSWHLTNILLGGGGTLNRILGSGKEGDNNSSLNLET